MTRKCRRMSMMHPASLELRFFTPREASRQIKNKVKWFRVWVIHFLPQNWTKWITPYMARAKLRLAIWLITTSMSQSRKIRLQYTIIRKFRARSKDRSFWARGIICLEVLLQEHSRLWCKMSIKSIEVLWGRALHQARPLITQGEPPYRWIHTIISINLCQARKKIHV